MPLPADVSSSLLAFYRDSHFAERGAVVTDLDGTAVHERDGRVTIVESVAQGLRALVALGRPVVIDTLRFPLNVIHTFGEEWGAITADPVPLVSLNGAVFGFLTPTKAGETTFDEVVAFPLSKAQIEETVHRIDTLLADGVDHIVLFQYARDWRAGETVWTPHPGRVAALRARYGSASDVRSTSVAALRDMLLAEGACMLSLVVDLPADRRMAYQHADPSGFITAPGVDKLTGAREAAARLGFDLDQSVGAGDTPMDRFLEGVGLAIHVGPMPLDFQGRAGTLRLADPFELGAALFELAGLDSTPAQHDGAVSAS